MVGSKNHTKKMWVITSFAAVASMRRGIACYVKIAKNYLFAEEGSAISLVGFEQSL
jgi:hypothetical protein